ncbi:NADPH:quinone oxidoreductase family protein [Caballeronia sp. SEWSISQ10-4 2]|uniref:NADPH:quinone oxidoreductase family protein n=1 Tax=Caballeronia sp. SEWSISQ10-4 2 TaxID=2937438 RepID=UPI00264E02CB|nr:NADPH:quinone oxidoreductase family protein [Caballeronia sp. SEWSISQ10-4 2]MDN7179485.1 NADPH:quinone oxidoreductase family protein [Caballeronia sp. SEWSISQ10-4 2]
MKALVCHAYGPIENLQVEEIDAPAAGRGQLSIDVMAASINFPDVLTVQGLYQVKPPLPFVPGAELAGTVRAVGEGVTGFRAGDRVVALTGTGAFAEQCVVDAVNAAPWLASLGFDVGASFVLAYGTSLHALQTVARLQAGETVLVLGAAGGVGIAAIEIAKALGARVIAAASNADKLQLAREAGADETVDYTQLDWRRAIDALTDGRGVDVVYDPVGGPYTEPALRATAWRGRYLVVGFAAGDIPKLPLNLTLLKERIILGVFWGEAMRREPLQHAANLRQLTNWVKAGRLRPAVTERVQLEGAAAAMVRLANRQAMGKLVVLPGDGNGEAEDAKQ